MKFLITEALTASAGKLRKKIEEEGNEVILASSNLPEFMSQNPLYTTIPHISDTSFAHKVLTLCVDAGIERIIPVQHLEANLLKEARVLFQEYGIEIMDQEYGH